MARTRTKPSRNGVAKQTTDVIHEVVKLGTPDYPGAISKAQADFQHKQYLDAGYRMAFCQVVETQAMGYTLFKIFEKIPSDFETA